MKIETKYDVGQEVFMLKNNKVKNLEISKIEIEIKTGYDYPLTEITYILMHEFPVKEEQIFATKEALLESL